MRVDTSPRRATGIRLIPTSLAGQANDALTKAAVTSSPKQEIGVEVEIAGQRGKRIEEAEQGLARAQAEVDNFERLLRGPREGGLLQELVFAASA